VDFEEPNSVSTHQAMEPGTMRLLGAPAPGFVTSGGGTYAKQEPELVPPTVVVRLIDAHAVCE
jgi:hypothetical protein